jgi:hypothetical protein
MKTRPEETALTEGLAQLERALLTPVIPGELEQWAAAAQGAATALAQPLVQYVENILHEQYAQIAKTDPEMLPRVEQLIATDKSLLEDFQKFQGKAARLVDRAPAAKKDENKVAALLTEIENDGTALILGIRKQQAAASTWLGEALYRDRGPVD